MKIEILTISGCPNASAALRLVTDVLVAEGLAAQVTTVEIKDVAEAKARRFLGSPTARVDGADIEITRREERTASLSCRVYPAATGLAGTPPREMIHAALHSARQRAPLPRSLPLLQPHPLLQPLPDFPRGAHAPQQDHSADEAPDPDRHVPADRDQIQISGNEEKAR